MQTGKATVVETILQDGQRLARISCPAALIPSAGQYALAGDVSNLPLSVPLFYTDSAPGGFICAPSISVTWRPGQVIYLRGPLGRGFNIPVAARKIALVAFDGSPWRLRGLAQPALKQGAVVLVSETSVDNFPDVVEVLPLSALPEIIDWADCVALDVVRENLIGLKEKLGAPNQAAALLEAQILIHTQMPCGGVAECGVCAISLKSNWKIVCKEGPVFYYRELFD